MQRPAHMRFAYGTVQAPSSLWLQRLSTIKVELELGMNYLCRTILVQDNVLPYSVRGPGSMCLMLCRETWAFKAQRGYRFLKEWNVIFQLCELAKASTFVRCRQLNLLKGPISHIDKMCEDVICSVRTTSSLGTANLSLNRVRYVPSNETATNMRSAQRKV